VKPTAACHNTR